MVKILVSSCLLGDNCRYDGSNNYIDELKELSNYEIIKFCPEVEGGLSIPRIPCEIKNDEVITKCLKNYTNEFNLGATKCLELCKKHNIKVAILKENSPSCGVYNVYDGTFTKTKIKGSGVTTSLLKRNGIKVFNELEIKDVKK